MHNSTKINQNCWINCITNVINYQLERKTDTTNDDLWNLCLQYNNDLSKIQFNRQFANPQRILMKNRLFTKQFDKLPMVLLQEEEKEDDDYFIIKCIDIQQRTVHIPLYHEIPLNYLGYSFEAQQHLMDEQNQKINKLLVGINWEEKHIQNKFYFKDYQLWSKIIIEKKNRRYKLGPFKDWKWDITNEDCVVGFFSDSQSVVKSQLCNEMLVVLSDLYYMGTKGQKL